MKGRGRVDLEKQRREIEHVARLVAHAERACHAAQSLRRPIPVELSVDLNGRQLTID